MRRGLHLPEILIPVAVACALSGCMIVVPVKTVEVGQATYRCGQSVEHMEVVYADRP